MMLLCITRNLTGEIFQDITSMNYLHVRNFFIFSCLSFLPKISVINIKKNCESSNLFIPSESLVVIISGYTVQRYQLLKL